MKIANDLVIYEVDIKQNLCAFLDISDALQTSTPATEQESIQQYINNRAPLCYSRDALKNIQCTHVFTLKLLFKYCMYVESSQHYGYKFTTCGAYVH